MNPQFEHTFPDRFAITKITRLHLPQANPDASLCNLVTQRLKPIGERLPAVFAQVSKQFNHGRNVA